MKNRAKRQKNNSSESVTVKRAPKKVNNGQDEPQKSVGILDLKKCYVKLRKVKLDENSATVEPAVVAHRKAKVRLARVTEISSTSPLTTGSEQNDTLASGSQPRRLSLRRKSTAFESTSRSLQSATSNDSAPKNVSPSKSPPVLVVFSPEATNSTDIWKRSSLRSLSLRRKSVAEVNVSSVQRNSVMVSPVPPPITRQATVEESGEANRTASSNRLRNSAMKKPAQEKAATVETIPAKRLRQESGEANRTASSNGLRNSEMEKPAQEKAPTVETIPAKRLRQESEEANRTASSNRLRNSEMKKPAQEKAPTVETIPAKRLKQAPKIVSTPSVAPKQASPYRNCVVKVMRFKDKPPVTARRKFTFKQKTIAPQPSPRKSPDIFSEADDVANESDIYAFNTQSSTGEEHEDIAADIIEKLKKEKKVTVSRHRRNPKPAKGVKKMPKMQPANWQKVLKNFADVPKGDLNKRNQPLVSKKARPELVPGTSKAKVLLNRTAPSGSLSRLAQKVLTKQTAALAPPLPQQKPPTLGMDKARLLQFAKDFVGHSTIDHSTPNKVIARPPSAFRQTADTDTPSVGEASPWRVNDEMNIPRTFYFSRTGDDLPSYSSDVLPSSQQSVAPTIRKVSLEKATSPANRAELSTTAIPHVSPLQSFDENILNISNIENISPVKPLGEKTNEKSALIGVNPRRGLTERSPLKAINILNIVTLPNRVNNPQPERNTMHKHSIRDKENAGVGGVLPPPTTKRQSKRPRKENNTNVSNESVKSHATMETSAHISFGFSDDEVNLEDDDVVEPLPKSMLPNKKRLSKRLHSLKRLLPPKPTRFSAGTIRSIFRSPNKQKDIREMLSSTRNVSNMTINEDSVAGTSRVDDDSSADEMSPVENNESNFEQDVHLFDDPEDPHTSFDASVKIRTYERPKRKVKRVKNFVLLSSGSEDEEENERERAAKPKRTRPTKHDKELNKFAKEFNSMCEDVEKYELVVDRSK